MKTIATVIAVDGKFATVETTRTAACEGCHKAAEGEGCSVCSLMGATDRKMRARARNTAGAVPGDRVSVESGTGRVLFYAVLVFVLPILLAIVGFGVASVFTEETVFRAVGALVGFFGTFVGVFFYSRAVQKNRCDIEITEILEKQETSDREN